MLPIFRWSVLILWILSLSGFVDPYSSSGRNKLVWFRDHALRMRDNQALTKAVEAAKLSDSKILPVFLWTSRVDQRTGGTASDVFLAHALMGLNETLGGNLAFYILKSMESGDDAKRLAAEINEQLVQVCDKYDCDEIYYSESADADFEHFINSERYSLGEDQTVTYHSFSDSYTLLNYSELKVPWKDIILNHSWRSPLIPFVDWVVDQLADENVTQSLPLPVPSIKNGLILRVGDDCAICDLFDEYSLGTSSGGTDWGIHISKAWSNATETDARTILQKFLDESVMRKDETRNMNKRTHLVSRLSPYLSRGLISPKDVYWGIKWKTQMTVSQNQTLEVDSLLRRICWRDYTYAVLKLFPDVLKGNVIREGYEILDHCFDSSADESINERLEHWKRGQTGFPLIDAGMRQLAKEGFMPQKVRLACGSFFVESLGVCWREGMDHFAEFLVDYDKAINTNMWMNSACVGLDPYYVGMSFKKRAYWDKDGTYVRFWCPELAQLPDSLEIPASVGGSTSKIDPLYQPWLAPDSVLDEAGVRLGENYPKRICDDRKLRAQFYSMIRSLRQSEWSSSMIDDAKRDVVKLGQQEDSERLGLFTPRAIQFRRVEGQK